jgi:DegV family protein with EDD domain
MIKIVTDSSSDLTKELAEQYDISIVALSSRFGEEVFRERIDITDDEFYEKMANSAELPSTIQPSPNDFLVVFKELVKEGHTVVCITISSKLSGTWNSAVQAKEMVEEGKDNITIIDSEEVSIALGLVVLAAAKAVKEGADLEKVKTIVNEAIQETAPICLLDTLKNLEKGGRIGKASALLGSILNVKPLISLKEGEVIPFGKVRSRAKGMDQLVEHVSKFKEIKDLAIAYSTTPDDAKSLLERLSAIYKDEIKVMRLGTTLGVHTGAGTIVLSVRGTL